MDGTKDSGVSAGAGTGAQSAAPDTAAASGGGSVTRGPPKAMLFDLDGTLVSSDPVHLEVFREFFAPYGVTVDEEYFNRNIHGCQNAILFPRCLGHLEEFKGCGGHEALMKLAEEKEAAFRETLRRRKAEAAAAPEGSAARDVDTGTRVTPGVRGLLKWAREAGLVIVCVTNAPRANAECMLEVADLASEFEHLVIGDECARGKPFPDPYIRGAEVAGVDAADCVVFEDSRTGITSGVAAGVRTVIAVRSAIGDEAALEAGASRVIGSFDEVTPTSLGIDLDPDAGAAPKPSGSEA